ncbi:MAG: hypothetical protein ACMXX7_02300 [Candidatus Woesearchaeota archaeon]
MDLKEWTKHFVEYRHSHRKELQDIEQKDNKIIATLKQKQTTYTITKILEITSENIVCLNTKSNFEFLIKNWDEFVSKDATIFFVNNKKNSYWAIKPSHHQKIIEKKTLKQGLKTLFESSEILNE